MALQYLPSFLPLGIFAPFTTLLADNNQIGVDSSGGTKTRDIKILKQTLEALVQASSDAAFELIRTLVLLCPHTAKSFGDLINQRSIGFTDLRVLPITSSLLGLSYAVDIGDLAPSLMKAAIEALTAPSSQIHDAALHILRQTAVTHVSIIADALLGVQLSDFDLQVARTLFILAKKPSPDLLLALNFLVSLGLSWAVRSLSNDDQLSAQKLEILKYLCEPCRL